MGNGVSSPCHHRLLTPLLVLLLVVLLLVLLPVLLLVLLLLLLLRPTTCRLPLLPSHPFLPMPPCAFLLHTTATTTTSPLLALAKFFERATADERHQQRHECPSLHKRHQLLHHWGLREACDGAYTRKHTTARHRRGS
jgi:hypothetical protein